MKNGMMILAALVALSACAKEPSPARQMLNAQCEQGDVNACGVIATIEAHEERTNLARSQWLMAHGNWMMNGQGY